MRLAVLALVLINALVLAYGLRGGFARLDARWSDAGPEIAPLSAPAQAGPTLALLHERTTVPGPSPQSRPPSAPDRVPPSEPAAGAHAPAPASPEPARPAMPDTPTSLAAAVEQAPPPQPTPSPAETVHTAPAPTSATDKTMPVDACVVVGPFDAQKDAARMRFEAAANDAGASLLGRETRTSGPARHWVVLEGFASEAAARAAVERLRVAGFADLAPVQAPDGWVVSLGIFGQAARAGGHRDAVRAAGFDAVLRERTGGATRQWLRFGVPAGVNVDALRRAVASPATLTACPPGEG